MLVDAGEAEVEVDEAADEGARVSSVAVGDNKVDRVGAPVELDDERALALALEADEDDEAP